MNAAKTTKPTTEKKLTMNLTTGKIAVKNETAPKADATPNIDQVLGVHIPVFAKADQTKGSEPASKPAKVAKEKVVKEPSGPTKADVAREIYKRMAGKDRKDVLKAFQDEAKLTPAGSATYYANFKREAAKAPKA